MANICDTTYKVTGTRKAVSSLWNTLQEMDVNNKSVNLSQLAERYGIDYEKRLICVRGFIYWAEYEENEEDDYALLSFDTQSAWSSCESFFEALNEALGNELSISWREIEIGCDLYYVHDENNYFPEECYVTASGDIFEDCEDSYMTVADAIKKWCEVTGVPQDGRSDEEMMSFINDYEYEDEGMYFAIHPFEFG